MLMWFSVSSLLQFVMVETITCGLVDCYPKQLSSKKTLLTAGLIAGFLVLQLPYVTRVRAKEILKG